MTIEQPGGPGSYPTIHSLIGDKMTASVQAVTAHLLDMKRLHICPKRLMRLRWSVFILRLLSVSYWKEGSFENLTD